MRTDCLDQLASLFSRLYILLSAASEASRSRWWQDSDCRRHQSGRILAGMAFWGLSAIGRLFWNSSRRMRVFFHVLALRLIHTLLHCFLLNPLCITVPRMPSSVRRSSKYRRTRSCGRRGVCPSPSSGAVVENKCGNTSSQPPSISPINISASYHLHTGPLPPLTLSASDIQPSDYLTI
jgi:hypothetical protein